MRGASHDPANPGVVLFTLTHLYPCFAAQHRARLRARLGRTARGSSRCWCSSPSAASSQAGAVPVPCPSIFCLSGAHPGDGDHARSPLSCCVRGRGRTISVVGWCIPSCSGAALVGGPSGGEQRGAFSGAVWRARSLGLSSASSGFRCGSGVVTPVPPPPGRDGDQSGAGLALTALLIFWGHGWLTGIPCTDP